MNARSASLALLVLALIGFAIWAVYGDTDPTVTAGARGVDDPTESPETKSRIDDTSRR